MRLSAPAHTGLIIAIFITNVNTNVPTYSLAISKVTVTTLADGQSGVVSVLEVSLDVSAEL